MKCGLVQILAVAMVLGHTVSMLDVDAWMKYLRNLPKDEPSASGVTKVAKSVESGEMQLANTLPKKVDDAIQQITDYNFAEFENENKKQKYPIVDQLFDIRKSVKDSAHVNKNRIITNIDKSVSTFVEKLQNAAKNAQHDLTEYKYYLPQIDKGLSNIINNGPRSSVKIEWINKVCSKAGIELLNTDEYLPVGQMTLKLIEAKKVLKDKIAKTDMIVREIGKLLHNLGIKIMRTYDTRDTQSMRNVIGISIAVCAIVTLCIVLLIAVRNKNRTNAGVRLVNWV